MEICVSVEEDQDIYLKRFVWIEKSEIMENQINPTSILTNGANVLLLNYMMIEEDKIAILLLCFMVFDRIESGSVCKVNTPTLKSVKEWEAKFEWEIILITVKWHVFLFK